MLDVVAVSGNSRRQVSRVRDWDQGYCGGGGQGGAGRQGLIAGHRVCGGQGRVVGQVVGGGQVGGFTQGNSREQVSRSIAGVGGGGGQTGQSARHTGQ